MFLTATGIRHATSSGLVEDFKTKRHLQEKTEKGKNCT